MKTVAIIIVIAASAIAAPVAYHSSSVVKGATQLMQKSVIVTNQQPNTIVLTLTQETQYQILGSTNADMRGCQIVAQTSVPPMNVTITNNGGQMFFRARLGYFNPPQVTTNQNQ